MFDFYGIRTSVMSDLIVSWLLPCTVGPLRCDAAASCSPDVARLILRWTSARPVVPQLICLDCNFRDKRIAATGYLT